MRLETEDGHFVANVEPVLPLEPTEIVIWGERFFIRAKGFRSSILNVWCEVRPTVVRDA